METLSERSAPLGVHRHLSFVVNPLGLLADLADSPIAIGLYNLIGRRYAISQLPVPLSARDVMLLDATITYGAAVRALERLTTSAWAIEQRRDGWKSTYVPTWGRVKSEIIPWQIGAERNGRPTHLHQVKIDARLLDTCIGRIVPHERHPAQITRYLSAPLLSLRDVGVYALARSGRPDDTPALKRWGLIRDGQVNELPPDDELVAYASQLCLHDPAYAFTLTEHGMRVLGPVQPAIIQSSMSTTLFFVDKGVIGRMIGGVIDTPISNPITIDHALDQPNIASESPKASVSSTKHSASCIESIESKGCITTSTAGGDHQGCDVTAKKRRARNEMHPSDFHAFSANPSALPDSPTVELLRSINVRPAQILELAQIPLEPIQAAIQDAESRPGLRDKAGWIVKMLRDWRDHGWQIRPPQSTTVVDWGALAAEYVGSPGVTTPDICFSRLAVIPDAAQSTLNLRSYLAAGVERKHQHSIASLEAEIRGTVAIITCTTVQQRDMMTTLLAPAIRSWLSQYCDEGTVQFVLRSPDPAAGFSPEQQGANELACPEWISLAQWQQLGIVLRGILHGSVLQEGMVCGKTAHMNHLIHTRYRNEIQQLLAPQSP